MGSSDVEGELQRCCVDLSFHSSHIYGPISGLPFKIFQIGCAIVLARCDNHTDPLIQLIHFCRLDQQADSGPLNPFEIELEAIRSGTESHAYWNLII